MAFRIETALQSRLPRDDAGGHVGFALGEDIDLTDPQVHRTVCVRGFAGPEYDGTWTEQRSAQLLVRLAAGHDRPVAVWLAAMPFVTERHSQIVDFACDGVGVGHATLGWAQAGRQVFRFDRPAAAIGDPWLRIAIAVAVPWSPADEGLSNDSRPLGLKIGRLAITATDAPPPPLFDGPAIAIGHAADEPAPAWPDARAGLIEAKLDLLVAELRATRAIVERTRRDLALE